MNKAKAVICIVWFLNSVFIGMCHLYYSAQQPTEKLRDRVSPRTYIPRKLYFWSYALNASLFLLLTNSTLFYDTTQERFQSCVVQQRDWVKSGESV